MADRILVIGEALIDIVRHADGTAEEHPGGSPANVALALARLEAPVELLTAFGPDARGDLLEQHLTTAGVTFAASPRILPRTSTAEATLDGTGSASYAFDLLGSLPHPPPSDARVHVHTGSIAAVLEPGASVVARTLGELAGRGTVSYDVNARPAATGTGSDVRSRVERTVALSDIVKVSEEDLAALYPGQPVASSVHRLLSLGTAAVVVTYGGQGASVTTSTVTVEVPATVVDVVDTIGAGDTFCAALLDSLWRAGVLGAGGTTRLGSASAELWHRVLRRANHAAALSVARAGANPPTAAELARRTEEDQPAALT